MRQKSSMLSVSVRVYNSIECIHGCCEANTAIKPNQHNQIISCIISVIANSNVDPLLPYHSALCRLIFKHFVLPSSIHLLALTLNTLRPPTRLCLSTFFAIDSQPLTRFAQDALRCLQFSFIFRLRLCDFLWCFHFYICLNAAKRMPFPFVHLFHFYLVVCFEWRRRLLAKEEAREKERELSDGVDVKNTYSQMKEKWRKKTAHTFPRSVKIKTER